MDGLRACLRKQIWTAYALLLNSLMDSLAPSSSTQTIKFPGQYDSLAEIGEFVTRAARSAGLAPNAVYAVEMAVDEACTNIIEHAYGGQGRGDIECTCQINARGLEVTLRDQGSSFDPSDIPEPNIGTSLEERDEGGLGLFLIRKLMDEVFFESKPDSGNVLTMVKRKETDS